MSKTCLAWAEPAVAGLFVFGLLGYGVAIVGGAQSAEVQAGCAMAATAIGMIMMLAMDDRKISRHVAVVANRDCVIQLGSMITGLCGKIALESVAATLSPSLRGPYYPDGPPANTTVPDDRVDPVNTLYLMLGFTAALSLFLFFPAWGDKRGGVANAASDRILYKPRGPGLRPVKSNHRVACALATAAKYAIPLTYSAVSAAVPFAMFRNYGLKAGYTAVGNVIATLLTSRTRDMVNSAWLANTTLEGAKQEIGDTEGTGYQLRQKVPDKERALADGPEALDALKNDYRHSLLLTRSLNMLVYAVTTGVAYVVVRLYYVPAGAGTISASAGEALSKSLWGALASSANEGSDPAILLLLQKRTASKKKRWLELGGPPKKHMTLVRKVAQFWENARHSGPFRDSTIEIRHGIPVVTLSLYDTAILHSDHRNAGNIITSLYLSAYAAMPLEWQRSLGLTMAVLWNAATEWRGHIVNEHSIPAVKSRKLHEYYVRIGPVSKARIDSVLDDGVDADIADDPYALWQYLRDCGITEIDVEAAIGLLQDALEINGVLIQREKILLARLARIEPLCFGFRKWQKDALRPGIRYQLGTDALDQPVYFVVPEGDATPSYPTTDTANVICAYELPSVASARPLREAQRKALCGLHAVNQFVYMHCRNYGLLISEGSFDRYFDYFIAPTLADQCEILRRKSRIDLDDLARYLGFHRIQGYPAASVATLAWPQGKRPRWTSFKPDLDDARAVALTFRSGDDHSVTIVRSPEGGYLCLDSLQSDAIRLAANSMEKALHEVVTGVGEEAQSWNVMVPVPNPEADCFGAKAHDLLEMCLDFMKECRVNAQGGERTNTYRWKQILATLKAIRFPIDYRSLADCHWLVESKLRHGDHVSVQSDDGFEPRERLQQVQGFLVELALRHKIRIERSIAA